MKDFTDFVRMGTPGIYQLTVQGQLDPDWGERLGGMEIMTFRSEDGQSLVTVLTGELMDQADLFGILNLLYDIGFPLLSVKRLAYVTVEE